ncbi:MAG: hypothetical protein ACLS7Z_03435 [Christensenellales bacterium]
MCWNAQYALLIAASTLVTYLCALALGRDGGQSGRRAVWRSACDQSGHFVFFKYLDFYRYIRANCRASGVRMAIPAFDVLLPVGISFYTFQALGYRSTSIAASSRRSAA